MARKARIVVEGLPHHIMQRGNYGQEVFFDDEDYRTYLEWVMYYSERYCLKILGYCLLPNHIHFIVIPDKKSSMSRVFNIVNMKYAQYMNKKMEEKGHLWQGRYYSCVMDDLYVAIALKHIEDNPVRSGLVEEPWEWKWSSCAYHVGVSKPQISLTSIDTVVDMTPDVWRRYLMGRDRVTLVENFVKHSILGRPLGSEQFIQELEKKLSKSLKVAPRGRPKKTVK